MFGFLLWWFKIFITLYENAHLHWSSNKTQFYDFLVVEYCISLNIHLLQSLRILNLYNKNTKTFVFVIFGLNDCLYSICHVKAVQDVNFSKLFNCDCVTLYLLSMKTWADLMMLSWCIYLPRPPPPSSSCGPPLLLVSPTRTWTEDMIMIVLLGLCYAMLDFESDIENL